MKAKVKHAPRGLSPPDLGGGRPPGGTGGEHRFRPAKVRRRPARDPHKPPLPTSSAATKTTVKIAGTTVASGATSRCGGWRSWSRWKLPGCKTSGLASVMPPNCTICGNARPSTLPPSSRRNSRRKRRGCRAPASICALTVEARQDFVQLSKDFPDLTWEEFRALRSLPRCERAHTTGSPASRTAQQRRRSPLIRTS